MIDSHCHLTDKQFTPDLPAVLSRAEENGIDALVCIADTLEEAERGLKLAEKYEQIFCTIGVHPHAAKDWQAGDAKRMATMLEANAKAKAVGEIGLDYYYDNSPRDVQQAVFQEQLELAQDLDYPAVIHNRESITDLRRIVEAVDPPSFVIHCCTERWDDVAWVVERGCLLSFTGIATYPKSEAIRETIKHCPLDQMMIETDAPYLAPVPHRGQRNEPAYVVEVAKCIAEVKGVELAEVDEVTTQVAAKFYSL